MTNRDEPREEATCPNCGSNDIKEEGDKYDWYFKCHECDHEESGGLL